MPILDTTSAKDDEPLADMPVAVNEALRSFRGGTFASFLLLCSCDNEIIIYFILHLIVLCWITSHFLFFIHHLLYLILHNVVECSIS